MNALGSNAPSKSTGARKKKKKKSGAEKSNGKYSLCLIAWELLGELL